MKNVLRQIGRVVGTGLLWAIVWAPVAVLAGLVIDPEESMDEMWFAIGAYPGFLCGALFVIILLIAERGRAQHALSFSRSATWGAASGILVGILPFLIGDATDAVPLWQLMSVFIGATTLLSAVSALVTTSLRRRLSRRAPHRMNA